jgi:hypothetical protein
MFSYSPQTQDTSGQILGGGIVNSANINAQAKVKLVDDIGQALMTIGSAYKDYSDMKSSIKSGEKMLDVLGPAIGMTTEKLKTLGYNDMKDREKAMFFNGLFGGGLYASAAQAINFGNKLQQTQNAPYVAQDIKNQQNIASGNVPYGGGMAPVEPPLPVADENLPPVGGAPMAAPMPIPGGDESMRRYNEWRRQRGY